MRATLLSALLLAAAPAVAQNQPPGFDCGDRRRRILWCFGELFVGDGPRRTRVVVDGRPVGPAPVLLHLDPQRAHTVRVGSLRRRVRLRPRAIVEVEADAATAARRAVADEAELALLRNRAPLGYASVVRPDTCGGPWIVPLPRALPINAWRAHQLRTELPMDQARRVVPRPEELVAPLVTACEGGDPGACEDAAAAHRALAEEVPGMSEARATSLLSFGCETLRSARLCDGLGRMLGDEAGEALLRRACAEGFSESCRTLAITLEVRTLQELPTRRPTDMEESRGFYRRCCALGNAACCMPPRSPP